MKEISFPIEITEQQVMQNIGYKSRKRRNCRIEKGIRDAIKAVVDASDTRAVYAFFPVTNDGDFIKLNSEVKLFSRKIGTALQKCTTAAVFIATLGPNVDSLIKKYYKIRMYMSVIIDTVASHAVECGAQYIQTILRDRLEKHKWTTVRYSPGYCDWPLKEQKKLFSLLPENPPSVTLSSTCLMSPQKSISGIIGIGHADEVKKYGNACKTCKKVSCLHRRDN